MTIEYGSTQITTTTKTKRAREGKGRSRKTNKNKTSQLKKRYKNLFNASQKKKRNNPQGKYFCDKYPTCDIFLDSIKLKQPNISK